MGPFVSLVGKQDDSTVARSKWEEIKAQQGGPHADTLIGRDWIKPVKSATGQKSCQLHAQDISSFNCDLFRSVSLRGSITSRRHVRGRTFVESRGRTERLWGRG